MLRAGKTLLVPQPRLRTGFFSSLTAASLPVGVPVEDACSSAGVAKYGTALSLDSKIRVDLIVVGSSCISPNGARLGKGEGFAELEYGMLRHMGAINETTPVVSSIHDCQARARGPRRPPGCAQPPARAAAKNPDLRPAAPHPS